jgi:hypothetical protein
MTGPFAFFTTPKSGETFPPAFWGGAAAAALCSFSEAEHPVITAAALMTALRIKNVLRSTEAGRSSVFNSAAGRKSVLSRQSSDLGAAPVLKGNDFSIVRSFRVDFTVGIGPVQ